MEGEYITPCIECQVGGVYISSPARVKNIYFSRKILLERSIRHLPINGWWWCSFVSREGIDGFFLHPVWTFPLRTIRTSLLITFPFSFVRLTRPTYFHYDKAIEARSSPHTLGTYSNSRCLLRRVFFFLHLLFYSRILHVNLTYSYHAMHEWIYYLCSCVCSCVVSWLLFVFFRCAVCGLTCCSRVFDVCFWCMFFYVCFLVFVCLILCA